MLNASLPLPLCIVYVSPMFTQTVWYVVVSFSKPQSTCVSSWSNARIICYCTENPSYCYQWSLDEAWIFASQGQHQACSNFQQHWFAWHLLYTQRWKDGDHRDFCFCRCSQADSWLRCTHQYRVAHYAWGGLALTCDHRSLQKNDMTRDVYGDGGMALHHINLKYYGIKLSIVCVLFQTMSAVQILVVHT